MILIVVSVRSQKTDKPTVYDNPCDTRLDPNPPRKPGDGTRLSPDDHSLQAKGEQLSLPLKPPKLKQLGKCPCGRTLGSFTGINPKKVSTRPIYSKVCVRSFVHSLVCGRFISRKKLQPDLRIFFHILLLFARSNGTIFPPSTPLSNDNAPSAFLQECDQGGSQEGFALLGIQREKGTVNRYKMTIIQH